MNAEKEETEYSRVAGLGFLPQAAPQPGASFADEMMQRHLQQCLEYHEQQLQSADTVPHFVKAMQVEEDDELIHQEMKGTSIVMAVRQTEPPSSTVVDDATKIQVARDRAQEIISRFQQQQQHFLSEPPESFTTGTSVFAAVRRISLAKEEERKQRFLEKNLKYVSAREQQRMHQQAAELSAAEEWNREYLAIIEERQQQRYETQKQRKDYIAIQAGIGASFRKNLVDRQFQKGGGVRNSIAVYVSGFEDSSSVDENVLRDLFRTYGNIEKIHLYRDKIQGNMKGDGLIIFEGCQNTEEFLDTVCQQSRVALLFRFLSAVLLRKMNGVQLPCGTTLNVEPSLSNKKAKSVNSKLQKNSISERVISATKEPQTAVNKSNDDEDLDEFFASL